MAFQQLHIVFAISILTLNKREVARRGPYRGHRFSGEQFRSLALEPRLLCAPFRTYNNLSEIAQIFC